MKNDKVWALGLFVACLLIFTAGIITYKTAANPNRPRAPLILIDKAQYDCPPVLQGEKAAPEKIEIRNIGDETLIIEKIQTECHCTVVEGFQTPQQIPPGQSKQLTLQVDTSDFTGIIDTKVSVVSNAANDPEKVFSLRVAVKPALVVSPPQLDLGKIDLSKGTFEFEVLATVTAPYNHERLTITRLPAGLVFARSEPLPLENAIKFVFSVDASVPQLVVDDKIGFTLEDNGNSLKQWARIRCHAFRDCIIEPYPLSIGALPRNSSMTVECTLSFTEEIQRIDVLEPSNDALQSAGIALSTKLDKKGPRSYALSVTTSGKERNSYNCLIPVSYVDASGQSQELKVPVFGVYY